MARPAADGRRWDARIARARQLAGEHPAAREMLSFYAELVGFQKAMSVETIESAVSVVPDFLAFLDRSAPARLAEDAAGMRERGEEEWRALFERYWRADAHDLPATDDTLLFVVEALLQPFAESLAIANGAQDPNRPAGAPRPRDATAAPSPRAARCPVCTGRPVVGVLRESAQSARRSLVCALCLTDWQWPRVVCPACGENNFEALAVYGSEAFTGVRVDACDTCRRYLKTIDLTQNALAVPIVDELASVPLDLWAREHRYTKLRPNLLRL